jgi:hypothetical protein
MAESFLQEQLERIKRLTKRMTAVETQSERLANEMAHDREAMHHGPLHDVRDYRTYSRPTERDRASTARDSSPSSAASAARRRRHR